MLTRTRRLFLIVLAIVLSVGFALTTARAELEQRALGWSAAMLELAPAWSTETPRELLVNGARLDVTTGRSDLSLSGLLNHLEARCLKHSRVVTDAQRKRVPVTPRGLLDGVFRVEREREGLVACLELGEEPLGIWGVLDKLAKFGRTGDLADVGSIRWVRVESREEGSFFVAVTSVGALPLRTMFPRTGDAPGADLGHVDRPHGSRRLFSVCQLGRAPAIVVYEAPRALHESWADFLAGLERSGFESLADPRAANAQRDEPRHAGVFTRQGAPLLTLAEPAGKTTLIVVSALGGGDDALSSPPNATIDAVGPIQAQR